MKGFMEFDSFITSDGQIYDLSKNFRWIPTQEGYGMPDIEYLTVKSANQHGETPVGFRLKPRVLQLQIRQSTGSRFDYWTERALLLEMLRPNRSGSYGISQGTLRKKFSDGSIRDIDVLIEKGPGFAPRSNQWDEWGYTETLRFIAYDPLFYNPTPTELSFDFSAADPEELLLPATFPISFGSATVSDTDTITCNGTWNSYPTIEVTGPFSNFRLDNESTEEFLQLAYNIPAGEILTFYLEFGNKRIVNNSGTIVNGILTRESSAYFSLFHIACDPEVVGGINTLTVSGSDISGVSAVKISINDRFVGI